MTSPSVKLLRTQTDDRLVALAAAGHERAFEAIVERYRRPLLRHCRRYLPEARAEDALQQALVSAWGALRRGDDVRELRPWLHRIVHNTSLNALRAAGYDYEQLHDTLHGSGGPAELAERRAVVRQTLAGLAALPERQREALLQIAVEGRSQEEVAEELGLSHGAVRQLVHRARTSLRTAATAVMPLPLAGWLAAEDGDRDLVARLGELVAGTGAGATLAKAGAVAALAGGAVAGPAVVDRIAERPAEPSRAAAIAAPARSHDDGAADRGPGDGARVGPAVAGGGAQDRSGRRDGAGGDDDRSGRRDGSGADDDRSGPGGGDEEDRSGPGGGDEPAAAEDRSGPSGGEDRSGPSGAEPEPDSSGSGSSGGDDRSGPSEAAPEPDTSGSGPSGSGSSGSAPEPDSSESGSSGSRSSGSGSSGSGSG
jgi:RNA polymerase sigma factor (sigma-70 family)